jgi:hypothetical protein
MTVVVSCDVRCMTMSGHGPDGKGANTREILGSGKVRRSSHAARTAPSPATNNPATSLPPAYHITSLASFKCQLNSYTMAKDIKEKKEKKEKRAEVDGVKKSKKDKKEKKSKGDVEMADALEAELEKAPEVSQVKVVDGEEGDEPRGALVPFALPLADDTKEVKKILKTVKKCTFPFRSPHTATHTSN